MIYSSNGLTLSGTMPGTGDITQVQSYQEVATWKGVSSQTGERITAVSAPLLYNGELVGIMRYVTSMRLVDRQVLVMTLVAVILSVSILILVYISNIYFVRSIVDPVKNITGIAGGLPGGVMASKWRKSLTMRWAISPTPSTTCPCGSNRPKA